MASPFPGMDPYLERFWNNIHGSLSVYIADELNEILPDDFRATMRERRIFATVDRPPSKVGASLALRSDPFTQTSIEIVAVKPEEKVVTAIEVRDC